MSFDKGLEFELVRRIQRLEQQTLDAASSAADTVAASSVPQVVGIAVAQGVGTFTVTWSDITSVTVLRYEVLIADNVSFDDALTRTTAASEYTFHEGDPEKTYYVKVRAVNSGGVGDYSAVLNTTTGRATFADLEAGAATSIVSDVIETFSPTLITAGPESATFGAAVVDVEALAVVMIFTNSEIDYDFDADAAAKHVSVEVEILRDGNPVGDSYFQSVSNDTAGTMTAAGYSTPETPGEGLFSYSLRYTIDDDFGGSSTITFVRQQIEVLQFLQGAAVP